MKINKVELPDIDLMEADVMENVETAIAEAVEAFEESKNDEKLAEAIRTQCHAIMDCFNLIFGEGTDRKIFGDKTNLRECINAFKELQVEISKTMEEENNNITSLMETKKVTRRK